jgi:5,6-dimethylbenzimidazole synthase
MPLAPAGKAHGSSDSKSEDRPEKHHTLHGQAAPFVSIRQGNVMKSISAPATQDSHAFSEEARAAVYQAIFQRRDVRGQFLPKPVPDEVLSRLLTAAHHAPSVGFMQPWNFLVVKSDAVKRRVHDAFAVAHAQAATMFEGDKRATYQKLKLEGIVESPVGICITCDRARSGPVVIGRTHIPTMDLYSSVCAVQNLWLAARAEGLGVGWVSIFNEGALQDALNIPHNITPIAYLCLGYVSHFKDKPELETAGWLPRLPIQDLLYFDSWGQRDDQQPLVAHLQREEAAAVSCGAQVTRQSAEVIC